MQSHSSYSTRENATPSSGTSPLASRKGVPALPPPPPPGWRSNYTLLAIFHKCRQAYCHTDQIYKAIGLQRNIVSYLPEKNAARNQKNRTNTLARPAGLLGQGWRNMCEHCCSSKGLNVFSHINARVKVKVEYGAGGGNFRNFWVEMFRWDLGTLEPLEYNRAVVQLNFATIY